MFALLFALYFPEREFEKILPNVLMYPYFDEESTVPSTIRNECKQIFTQTSKS